MVNLLLTENRILFTEEKSLGAYFVIFCIITACKIFFTQLLFTPLEKVFQLCFIKTKTSF